MNRIIQLIKSIPYRIVLKDLMKIKLFTGIYDAQNGTDTFMYGICTVMEVIAYNVGTKTADDFGTMFDKNMTDSEARLETAKDAEIKFPF